MKYLPIHNASIHTIFFFLYQNRSKKNVEGRIFLNSHKDRRKDTFFCEMYVLIFLEYHSSKMSYLGRLYIV